MAAPRKILFVFNPKAGNGNNGSVEEKLKSRCAEQDIGYLSYHTTGEGDQKRIREQIDQEGPDRVIAGGGDGTVQMVGEVCLEQNLELGILPLGSANGLATELDLTGTFTDAIEIALGEHTVGMDVLDISGRHCFHFADLGMNAALVADYAESGSGGFFGYVLSALRKNIELIDPFELTIQTPEKETTVSTTIAFIANARKLGTGVVINPGGSINDGKFEICVLRDVNLQDALQRLFGNEEAEDESLYEMISAKDAKLTCSRKIPFQVDGEYQGKRQEVEVQVLEQRLRVVVNESFLD